MRSVHYIKSQGDHGLGTVFSSRHVNGHDVGYGTDWRAASKEEDAGGCCVGGQQGRVRAWGA